MGPRSLGTGVSTICELQRVRTEPSTNRDQDMAEICNAELHIADSFGDNEANITCDLETGHALPHRHEFQRNGTSVVILFECDERYEPCEECQATTLVHRSTALREDEHAANVGRMQLCEICYARTCPACSQKHLCPCDGCGERFPAIDLGSKNDRDYYCFSCAWRQEGSAGGA